MSLELEVSTPVGEDSPAAVTPLPPGDRRAETVVRKIVRTRAVPFRANIPEDVAVALVIVRPRVASRAAGVSERTLRRHFVREGSTITAFAAGVRLQAARELYSLGWDTDGAASALGYSSPAAFRRFLRQSSGMGVCRLRREAGSSRFQ